MKELDPRTSASVITEAINRLLEDGGVGVLATLIAGPFPVGSKLLISIDGATSGSLNDDDLDNFVRDQATDFLRSGDEAKTMSAMEFAPGVERFSQVRILFERIQAEPRLVICGAGHVGAALAKLGALLHFEVQLIDDREEFLGRERFPDERIGLRVAQNWGDSVLEAIDSGRGVSVAVVTRGHKEDEQCLQAVMRTNPDYVGLIGSKRRTNMVLQRLRESGVNDEKLTRIYAPVGLDIGAVTPEEVALAILSEIVAVRRGGKGGPLSAWRRAGRDPDR